MKRSLRARIATSLAGYTLLLAVTLIGVGYSVNESLESMVWHAQLDGEMAAYLRQRTQRADASLPQTGKLNSYVVENGAPEPTSLPEGLRALKPGMHDDIMVAGIESAVMVRDVPGARVYMLMNIESLEDEERDVMHVLLALTVFGAGTLVLLVWWLSGRLVHPVRELADAVDRLQPGGVTTQRLQVTEPSTAEVQLIADAMNRMLGRADELIQREREFVNTVSHELRTPLAVIAGAAQLAEQQTGLPESVQRSLQRISQSVREVEQLMHLLLLLAKSPDRLHEADEVFSLDELLPVILTDHQHLTAGKSLHLGMGASIASRLRAPYGIVQIAISNLLRNAIENSDRGEVEVSVRPAGVVRIQDSGHGLSPEEISRIYSLLARGGNRSIGQGIGLPLIARICEHLSWHLDVQSNDVTRGTLMTLDLSSSLVDVADP